MTKKICLAIGVWLVLMPSPVVIAQEKHFWQPDKKKFCETLNSKMKITMGNWLSTLNVWTLYEDKRGKATKADNDARAQYFADRRNTVIKTHQDNRIKLKDEAIIWDALCK